MCQAFLLNAWEQGYVHVQSSNAESVQTLSHLMWMFGNEAIALHACLIKRLCLSSCPRFCRLCQDLVLSNRAVSLFTVIQTSTRIALYDDDDGFHKKNLKMFTSLLHKRLQKYPIFPDLLEIIKCALQCVPGVHSEHLGVRH